MKTYIDIGTNLLQGFNEIKEIENIDDSWNKIFIEPNPECWEFIEENIKNEKNTLFHKKALSDEKTTVTLITRSDKKCDVAATIMGEKFLKDSLNRWRINVNDFNEYQVETITFDELLKNIDGNIVIKLDAEGIEFRVLEYLLNSDKKIEKLYCEFHIHNDNDKEIKNEMMKSLNNKFKVIEWK